MYQSQPKKMLILYILEILQKYTDSDHRLSQKEILEILERDYSMKADRKSIRSNIMNLIEAGYAVEYKEIPRNNKNAKTGELEDNSVYTDYYLIKDFDDNQVKEIALLENIQRQDLNPIETARALKELGDTYGWTQEALADRLGKSRSVVANTLRLLSLCPEVIDLIEKGKLSAGHARSLVVVTNPEVQLKLAEQVINNKLTVRDMENAVKEVDKTSRKVVKTRPQLSMEMQEFIDIMEHKFSTKINVKGNDKKGKIIINYYNQDDLNRIYDIISTIHN